MDELVSICIPIYNGEKYLKECLITVINQTYTALEILIVDDGSTDESLKIVNEFMKSEPRIRLVVNPKNLGLVKNWQNCIKLARGTWIKFMFQDDTMELSCVEEMVAGCVENDASLCICSRSFIIEENTAESVKQYFLQQVIKLEETYPDKKKLTPIEIAALAKNNLFDNFLGEPITLLFKKKMVNNIGSYNPDLVQLVDYEFVLRACLHGGVVFIPRKLVNFRTHSLSSTNLKNSSDIKKIKVRYIEPLIMFHEYLFNRHFRLLRKQYGFLQLLKSAAVFYNVNTPIYFLPGSLKTQLFRDYKGLYIIKGISKALSLKKSSR